MLQDGGLDLILLRLDDVSSDQPLFTLVKPTATVSTKEADKYAGVISDSVKRWLNTGVKNELFCSRQVILFVIVNCHRVVNSYT
jgi:hypothetical protein